MQIPLVLLPPKFLTIRPNKMSIRLTLWFTTFRALATSLARQTSSSKHFTASRKPSSCSFLQVLVAISSHTQHSQTESINPTPDNTPNSSCIPAIHHDDAGDAIQQSALGRWWWQRGRDDKLAETHEAADTTQDHQDKVYSQRLQETSQD